MPIAFKVCRLIDGELISATDCGELTKYALNSPTRPNRGCGPLALFETLEQAKNFVQQERNSGTSGQAAYNYQIFKCVYTPSTYTALWPYRPLKTEFIYYGDPKTHLRVIQRYAPGAILADEVTLLEQVQCK